MPAPDLAALLKLKNPAALTATLREALGGVAPSAPQHILETPIDEVSFRIVDIEATGLSTSEDEAIEIAVYERKGETTRLLLDTLIQPRGPLPARITELTGIDAGALASAPHLGDVFERIKDALSGDAFVAHNAAADGAYLATIAWRFDPHWSPPPAVCTLKLSRELFPELRSHGLHDLAEAHHLPLPAHRARPDAFATTHLLGELLVRAKANGARTLGDLVAAQQRRRKESTQARVSPLTVEALPDGPGCYRFADESGHLLYVGYSTNVRRRVREHLYRALTPASLELRRRAVSVFATAAASELDAYVQEGEILAQERPSINVRNAEHGRVRYFRLSAQGAATLVAEPTATEDAIHLGPIILRRAERNVLRAVRTTFHLSARGERRREDEHPGRAAFVRFIRDARLDAPPQDQEAREILMSLRQSLFRAEAERLDALRPFRAPTLVIALEAPSIAYALSAGRETLRLDLQSVDAQVLARWLDHAPKQDDNLDLRGRRISAYVRAHPSRVSLQSANEVLFRLQAEQERL